MKIWIAIFFSFISFLSFSQSEQVIGKWEGKEVVHIKISALDIDTNYDMFFTINFTQQGEFIINLNSDNFVELMAFEKYKSDHNLQFNRYQIQEKEMTNEYELKLFYETDNNSEKGKIAFIDNKNIQLTIPTSSGQEIIKLKKVE